jgi:hypothetical protein
MWSKMEFRAAHSQALADKTQVPLYLRPLRSLLCVTSRPANPNYFRDVSDNTKKNLRTRFLPRSACKGNFQ